MKKDNSLLTLQETAKMLGVRPITLRKWDRENKLKAVRVGTRRDRKYRKADILAFIKKSETKKIEWQEYIRSGAAYHTIAQVAEALYFGLKKHFGRGIKYNMAYFEGDTLYWCYDMKDLYDAGRVIIKKLIQDKKFQDKFFDYWNRKSNETFKFIENNSSDNLCKLTDKQLGQIYKKYNQLMLEWYGVSIAIDAADEALLVNVTKRIKEILKNKLGKKFTEKEFNRVYNALTAPSHLSYLNNEREMILNLVNNIRQNKFRKESTEFKNKAKEIVSQYWWTGLGFARGKPKSTDYILEAIKEIEEKKIDIGKEIENIKNYKKITQSQKKEIERKYNFKKDKEIIAWLELSDRLVDYHDSRKEIQVKSAFWEYKIIDEISKRKKISANLLEWAEMKEIIDLIEKKEIDENELNQRASKFLYLNIDGKITKLSGKAAAKKHEEVLGLEIGETRDLQGISAAGGKVVGEAFVAITVNSAFKIKKGQILVTGMTTPDFVPAMKKAAAIVTDEGGITCHAAIVSRELNLPCVVGTKYATRLIKTGDIIEVKANHGVVIIIKKQK